MISDYSIYEPGKKERLAVAIAFFLALSFAGYIFYGTVLFGLALPFVFRRGENVYCRYRAEKRKGILRLQFRDFLFSLSSSFATGRHMEEAMEEAITGLQEVYGPSGMLAEELSDMLRCMREAGETDLQVWENFAVRSGLEETADFTAVFRACRETGGNMVQAVNKAAAVIGEKIAVEMEIRTIVSQKKLEGRMITAMPAVIVVFLQAVSPEYLQVMYQTFGGRVLMTLALAAMMAAYICIERITDIEV